MLERKIIIGLITLTNYVKVIRPYWNSLFLESSSARMISQWCIHHYDKHGKAPGQELESIFFDKVKKGLDKAIAEEIEEEILPGLSEEFVDVKIDEEILITDTLEYFKTRQLLQLSQQIENILENGKGTYEERVKEAEDIRLAFKPIGLEKDTSLDFSNTKNLREAFSKAFQEVNQPLVYFPKQLGQFWNHQFVAGGFMSFLAPEKRGKTYLLMEIALRAVKQGIPVAFFQAGDMNQSEQLKRIATCINKRSTSEKYCTEHYESVRDCVLNQKNECEKVQRECYCSPFDDKTLSFYDKLTIKDLIFAYENSPEYEPCYNCPEYNTNKLGASWIRKISKVEPLDKDEAFKSVYKFMRKTKGRLKLSTHANGTLSVNNIVEILDRWQDSEDEFIPKIIIVDYADLLLPSVKTEFRHQQNQIWKDLRKLSQTKRKDILPLVISPTQADAQAYNAYKLTLSNFSEDKRKYAHVTAMYGLNQDPNGREKGIGLLRINEIIIREGEYNSNNEVTVLQNLRRGKPFTGSYF